MQEQTLATLDKAPFNKLRMCVFPKRYAYNTDPPLYTSTRAAPTANWTSTVQPCLPPLRDAGRGADAAGIEADIILFHPYDRWGFAA